MRWSDLGRSRNLDDQRGSSGLGGMSGMRMGGLGLGGVALVVVFALLTKQNPLDLLQQVQGNGTAAETPGAPVTDPNEEPEIRFVSFVLDTSQKMWARMVPEAGNRWRDARLVVFRDQLTSACGAASAASGPFYCPGDEKVYLDLSFYDELKSRFGAPGEFAQAYVLAHEIGHHVQKVLGTEEQVRAQMERRPDQRNQLSVALELQADCYAGIWAHEAAKEGIVEAGDIDDGLRAAAAVGDDRIQRMGGGAVHPETWTHGSSAQRSTWFRRGFDSGTLSACQTFTGGGTP
jgi:predicted metalloprotease